MAQAPSLETLIFNDYLKRGMDPNEARANAQEAASSYRASSGLSDEEILGQLREQREAADWKSFANQVLTKSNVLSETPRRAGLQRLLGAGALTTSLNPETRKIGETALQSRMPDPAIRAAMEKSVGDKNQAQRTAIFDEKLRRGAIPLSANASPETIETNAAMRRPYDVSPMTAEQDRVNAALSAARGASAREALDIPEGGEMPAGGQSYRYDVPTNSRPFQPASEQARDVLRARLAVPVAGSIQPPEGTDPSEFGALDYVEPPSPREPPQAPAAGVAGASLPLMAMDSSRDGLGFRGGAFTPGTSWDRSSELNRPFNFSASSAAPAQASPKPWSSSARTEEERPTPARPAASRAPIDLTMGRPNQPAASESGSSIRDLIGKVFSGPEYQSTGQRVVDDKGVNWGSGDNPADFFRASKADTQRRQATAPEGEKRGGSVTGSGGKDAAMHKALEIIHHLLMRQR